MFNKLRVINGLLYRQTPSHNQLVMPFPLRKFVYQELHEEMGHLGIDRVYALARERFYWPNMESDIENHISKACKCVMDKKPNVNTRAPCGSLDSKMPFELVSLDFMKVDKCKGGFEYILVIIDGFTRYAECFATKNKSSKTAAEKLYNNFILRYGFPQRIHSDQGPEFINGLFRNLSKISGVKQTRTTPYHPSGNGQTERFNRTLISMLRTLTDTEKSNWKQSLPKLVHAYNCTRSDATGYAPYFLVFGRKPRLPIDLILSETEAGVRNCPQYVNDWTNSMKEAYRIANETIEKVRERSHKQYDKRLNYSTLDVGDNVLFRNFERSIGTSKLKSYWDKEVYQVVEKKGDGPVYCIQPLSGGKLKTVHRNLLLPCSFLPISDRHEPKNEAGNGLNSNGDTDVDEEIMRMTEIVDETQSNRDDQSAADDSVERPIRYYNNRTA